MNRKQRNLEFIRTKNRYRIFGDIKFCVNYIIDNYSDSEYVTNYIVNIRSNAILLLERMAEDYKIKYNLNHLKQSKIYIDVGQSDDDFLQNKGSIRFTMILQLKRNLNLK